MLLQIQSERKFVLRVLHIISRFYARHQAPDERSIYAYYSPPRRLCVYLRLFVGVPVTGIELLKKVTAGAVLREKGGRGPL